MLSFGPPSIYRETDAFLPDEMGFGSGDCAINSLCRREKEHRARSVPLPEKRP